ncbi:MAG: PilZ domain-containing protein [Lachnospiraceae bacterium]|nr:PilZ domain-containing protein [Lachnospiraceae bacterium]
MTQERRKSNRMDINVKIKLNSVKTSLNTDNLKQEEFEVELVNISRGGLAFRSNEKLALNTYYDTTIVLWTKEKFQTVIEIVRMENYGDEKTLYGCRFIGIMPSDQLKIQIYEMVSEMEKNASEPIALD